MKKETAILTIMGIMVASPAVSATPEIASREYVDRIVGGLVPAEPNGSTPLIGANNKIDSVYLPDMTSILGQDITGYITGNGSYILVGNNTDGPFGANKIDNVLKENFTSGWFSQSGDNILIRKDGDGSLYWAPASSAGSAIYNIPGSHIINYASASGSEQFVLVGTSGANSDYARWAGISSLADRIGPSLGSHIKNFGTGLGSENFFLVGKGEYDSTPVWTGAEGAAKLIGSVIGPYLDIPSVGGGDIAGYGHAVGGEQYILVGQSGDVNDTAKWDSVYNLISKIGGGIGSKAAGFGSSFGSENFFLVGKGEYDSTPVWTNASGAAVHLGSVLGRRISGFTVGTGSYILVGDGGEGDVPVWMSESNLVSQVSSQIPSPSGSMIYGYNEFTSGTPEYLLASTQPNGGYSGISVSQLGTALGMRSSGIPASFIHADQEDQITASGIGPGYVYGSTIQGYSGAVGGESYFLMGTGNSDSHRAGWVSSDTVFNGLGEGMGSRIKGFGTVYASGTESFFLVGTGSSSATPLWADTDTVMARLGSRMGSKIEGFGYSQNTPADFVLVGGKGSGGYPAGSPTWRELNSLGSYLGVISAPTYVDSNAVHFNYLGSTSDGYMLVGASTSGTAGWREISTLGSKIGVVPGNKVSNGYDKGSTIVGYGTGSGSYVLVGDGTLSGTAAWKSQNEIAAEIAPEIAGLISTTAPAGADITGYGLYSGTPKYFLAATNNGGPYAAASGIPTTALVGSIAATSVTSGYDKGSTITGFVTGNGSYVLVGDGSASGTAKWMGESAFADQISPYISAPSPSGSMIYGYNQFTSGRPEYLLASTQPNGGYSGISLSTLGTALGSFILNVNAANIVGTLNGNQVGYGYQYGSGISGYAVAGGSETYFLMGTDMSGGASWANNDYAAQVLGSLIGNHMTVSGNNVSGYEAGSGSYVLVGETTGATYGGKTIGSVLVDSMPAINANTQSEILIKNSGVAGWTAGSELKVDGGNVTYNNTTGSGSYILVGNGAGDQAKWRQLNSVGAEIRGYTMQLSGWTGGANIGYIPVFTTTGELVGIPVEDFKELIGVQ